MTQKSYLKKTAALAVIFVGSIVSLKAQSQSAAASSNCGILPDYTALKAALLSAVSTEASGLNNQMWATIVDRDGHGA